MATIESAFDTHLPTLDTDLDRYSPLSSPRECPSLTDSFGSSSWASGKHSGAVTPTTPVTAMSSAAQFNQRKVQLTPDTPFGFSRRDLADIFWEPEPHIPATTSSFMSAITEAELPYYPMYNVGMGNPPLSRPMFDIPDAEEDFSWSSHQLSSPQQTIAPSATFQAPLLGSSPVPKHEPCTPTRRNIHTSSILGSSPLGLVTPVVPSQHHVEELKYEEPEWAMLSSELRCRRTYDRISRRPYERKRLGGSFKPKPVHSSKSKSGIDCEVIIASNEFACSYPGCVDKSGQPKRFKRQEHKKRHEKTVHEKSEHGMYKCWVGGCKTAPFTRTDNLKSHLKNTHGKKSPNQRNRYVATQDRASVHYDPDWIGELTEDGYPVR
ncbi:Regulatory protein brlA [Cyphellophora attinorum]|uniref:Regulatory protein brlA n=1 Tax=Cyphellophora attinorum TaxID=1664694 RepID=A0A0N0NQK7_9EURO|nr:Regulatory protein brlA [Phialophora attinorum]KPI44021.1 Regulatory protein brlA [Phialophora attinorum]